MFPVSSPHTVLARRDRFAPHRRAQHRVLAIGGHTHQTLVGENVDRVVGTRGDVDGVELRGTGSFGIRDVELDALLLLTVVRGVAGSWPNAGKTGSVSRYRGVPPVRFVAAVRDSTMPARIASPAPAGGDG
ncbi:hypothetical protein J4H86_23640 [Spiractinospora alimapuensis]|uniref:hypothetical protein n=1 Tax=Spiractinospora alimapuensis TaxID=2820884 RepID=UPI001F165423|nr:hypothetical protein [Spiractinospora alimapuensis]QVQ51729.1 hypothetical protein J4H86_23640 [Spiractinospora alimapuensis]